MEQLQCIVERIVFHNENSGYTVLVCSSDRYRGPVTAVGVMADVHAGSRLTMIGEWKDDSRYGRQFHVQSVTQTQPEKTDRDSWLKTDLFKRIEHSKFRSSFHLKEADRIYLEEKGYREIEKHAAAFVASRLADSEPVNDGKQTPMRGAPKGHPVFLAQHACGVCCRGCLEKWHGIPQHRPLSEQEQKYIVRVIMEWITREYRRMKVQ